jgi:putative ABC transport system permease protein
MTLDRLLQIVRLRLRSLLRGAAADRELDEELRDHVERQVEEHIARGVRPEEARTLALRALGGVEQRKEEMRDARGVSLIEYLIHDLRLALRQLRQQPAFAATAILSLALGIGANTAIFQLLNALAFRPLPVRAPQELVEVRLTGAGRSGRHSGRNRQVSLPQYQEFLRRQQAFSSMLAFSDTRFNLATSGEVRYADGLWVSGNYFEVLGVAPVLGRLMAPADDVPGCAGVAVISYALWQSEFGGRADVVGQTVPGVGVPVPIIGVTPPGFFGVEVGKQFGVALPLCASGYSRRDHWWLATVGRLRTGWTTTQAEAHFKGLISGVQQDTVPDFGAEYREPYLTMGVELVDASAGISPLRRSYQRPLSILMAIAGLVLLIAAANLANLLLARATARQAEFAVRLALGGSRRRLLQQVLTESLLIAALGSAAAVAVAMVVSQSIPPLISTSVDRVHLDLAIDWQVFAFTAIVGIATALLFGMAPALRATRTAMFRGQSRGSAANAGLGIRRALVSLQIAVTLVLLFGGLLFLRTFQNLASLDTGINERGIVVANVFFPEKNYPVEGRVAAYRAIDERLRALPGVVSLSEAFMTPLGGTFRDNTIIIDGQKVGESNINEISAGYFATLGTALTAGRDFDDRDVPGSPRVAIVNEAFAQAYLTAPAVGQRFTIPDDRDDRPGTEFEVIGVVANQKYLDMREEAPRILYNASSQNPTPSPTRRYVIRSTLTAADAVRSIGAELAAIDPNITVRYSPLDTQLTESMLQERLMARLSAIFGGVALLLAIVGLYGVVSYTVACRRAEIGVRVALGASRSRILGMVLGDVGRMVAIGIAAGTAFALLASSAVGSLLYGLEPTDPATLAIAMASLLGTSLIAALLPARRAAGIDPLTALREQ